MTEMIEQEVNPLVSFDDYINLLLLEGAYANMLNRCPLGDKARFPLLPLHDQKDII